MATPPQPNAFRRDAASHDAPPATPPDSTHIHDTLLDSLEAQVWAFDRHGCLTWLNRHAQLVSGLSLDQARGNTFVALLPHWDDAPRRHLEHLEVMSTGRALLGQQESCRVHGDTHWYAVDKAPIRDETDTVIGLVLLLRDITDLKRTEDRTTFSRLAQDHAADGLTLVDGLGRILWANTAFCRMHGLSLARALERTIDDCRGTNEDDFQSRRRQRLLGDGPPTFETLHRRLDGSLFPVEVSLGCLSRDNASYTSLVVRDISPRYHAHSEMAALRQWYRLLVDHASDIMYRTDVDGRFTFVNASTSRLLGYTEEELLGRRFSELLRPDMRAAAERFYGRQYIRRTPNTYFEFPAVTKDGREIWFGQNVQVLLEQGIVVGFQAIVRDLTASKGLEQELREVEARWNHAFESSGDGVWDWDCRSASAFFSSRWKSMFGHTDADVPSQLDEWESRIHPADRVRVLAARARHLRNETRSYSCEYRMRCKDQSYKWVLDRGKVISRAADGGPLRMVGTLTDITELKMTQEALTRAHAELEQRVHTRTTELTCAYEALQQQVAEREKAEAQFRQAQKLEAIGRLAGGVAHDFNNLLTVIQGYTDLLMQQGSATDPARSYLQEILQAGERAQSLTRQLLAFSRQQVLDPRPVDLNQAIANFSTMLHRLIGEDIQLETHASPSLGLVHADPGQLDQVIMNLVVNAKDAMPNGGRLTLETRDVIVTESHLTRTGTLAPGAYVLLTVRDTGSGIPESILSQIFDPFFTTKALGRGTGLGLSMVLGIVSQSGGAIDIESQVGVGTTFSIYLPRTDRATAPTPLPGPQQAAPAGTESILLVEDNLAVRTLTCRVLQEHGYQVHDVPDSAEAIRYCESDADAAPMQVLLTDVVMPLMNGRDLADHIIRLRPAARILFMSGYTDTLGGDQEPLFPHVRFLQKPFTPSQLLHALRELLNAPPHA